MRSRTAAPVLIALVLLPTLAILPAPLAAEAQQAWKVPLIGILAPKSPVLEAFRQGLQELGYVEGLTVIIEYRLGEYDWQFPRLAADLARLRVDAIVTWGTLATLTAKDATKTIPIVMAASGDPVETGQIASFTRPGGNVTGLAFQESELAATRIKLLKATVPMLTRLAVLWDPIGGESEALSAVQHAAARPELRIRVLQVSKPTDFDARFEAARQDGEQAVIQLASPFLSSHRSWIAELAITHRLPAICDTAEFVQAGCLMSYGPNFREMARRAATYVDRILKGAKPIDLLVEQPTKFELVINLKTAKALGLTIPPSLLLRADQVIE